MTFINNALWLLHVWNQHCQMMANKSCYRENSIFQLNWNLIQITKMFGYIHKIHSVWNLQKKSHSKVRATFTFWVDKSWSKVPKMVHFVFRSLKLKVKQYYQTCHFWRKIPKLKYSNSTFSAIFKHCEINEALIEFVSKQQSETFLFIFAKLRSWMSCLAVGNDFSWLRLHTRSKQPTFACFLQFAPPSLFWKLHN